MSDKPAAAPAPTPTDDLLAIAEVVGNIKDRFERLEAEHATQSAPLAAAAQALQAALAGLTALKSHVLENSITVLSTRVEDQRRAIDEQVTALVAELRAADQQAAQFTRSESEAIRASLAELRGHFERTAREFSARAERFDAEIKTAATRFAALPAVPGRDGASFNPAGTWSASQAGGYKRLSVVSYMGGSYLSNEDENTEKPGPKSLKWTQLAARGPGGGSGDISGLTGVASATQGGTGFNSYTVGDILYASSSTTLAKLGAGDAGQFLVSNGAGTAPSWGTGTSGALPSMTGNSGKLLTTDGTNASWTTAGILTSLTGPTTTNLTLAGGSSGASLVLGQGSNNAVLTLPSGKLLAVYNASSANSIANIGLGTNSGFYFVAPASNQTFIGSGMSLESSTWIARGGTTAAGLHFNTNSFSWFTDSGLTNGNSFSPTERMRLSTGSNLLIGGTTDISGSGGLKVFGTTAATSTTSGAVQIGSNIGLSGNSGGPSYFGGAGSFSDVLTVSTSNDYALTGVRTSGATNAIARAGLIQHTTSGDMVDGFGAAQAFAIRDSAGATNIVGDVAFVRNGADNTGDFVIRPYTTGSANSRFTVKAAGDVIATLNASAPSLTVNSTMTFELTSNTSLTIKVRGTDGTTRSVALTLA